MTAFPYMTAIMNNAAVIVKTTNIFLDTLLSPTDIYRTIRKRDWNIAGSAEISFTVISSFISA